jgi:Fungalysin metallopeptidase (M36)/Fungalysin/Thermolysin Propeptide Motif
MHRMVLALSVCAGTTFSALGVVAPRLETSPRPTTNAVSMRSDGKPLLASASRFQANGFPNYDVRIGGEIGLAAPEVVAARDASPVRLAARDKAVARLRETYPDLTVDLDQFTGTVSSVRSLTQMLTSPGSAVDALSPIAAADRFIDAWADVFEITSAELDQARISRNFSTDHNGATHLTFQQQHRGVDVAGCTVIANVDRFGSIINIGSTFIPGLSERTLPAASISARDAVQLAAANVGISLASRGVGESVTGSEPELAGADEATRWSGLAELRADEPVITRRVWFPRTSADVRPAYTVVVPAPGIGHTYDITVDAVTGEVLCRTNRLVWDTTQPITMRIFTSDSPAPGSPGLATVGTTQFPSVARSLVTITPDQMRPYSPNGWIDDNAHLTLGNNVDAHTDLTGANTIDTRPDGGVSRVFDFTYSDATPPGSWSNFAVVQMFYFSNKYHDALYSLGFNEVAGNFQTNNFARGGAGGDAVIADGQDGGGTNNANWSSTGADGSSGRMQMYVFTGPSPARDGTIDGDIVYHELSHGLSIRLHQGISANVTRGMGEGWSDYFAISLNAEATDDPNANYCTGGYATKQFLDPTFLQNYYFGIRRFPYSTNLNINPQTFADTDDGQQNYPTNVPRSAIIPNTASEVHNMGEVWCNTLLECRAGMWNTQGFDANSRMMRLVVDGMKLHTVTDPNFLQSRDTILQADNVDYGGADRGALWIAFAKRGMGSNASAPASTTSAGVVENYQVPFDALFTYPSGKPAQLLPGQTTSFPVDIGESNLTLVPNSGQLHYSVNGGAFSIAPMTQTSAGHYVATIPAFSCFDVVRYYTSVDTNYGRKFNPASAPVGVPTAKVYTSVNSPITDTGETDEGWTVSTVAFSQTPPADGAWERGVPLYSGSINPANDRGDPPTDYDHVGTGKCWLTKNNATVAASNTDVDNCTTTITSRTFATTAGDTLSFAAWCNANVNGTFSTGDGLKFDYSLDNGVTWTNLRFYSTPSNTWRPESFLIGTDIPVSRTMKVRFAAIDTGVGNVVECAMDAFTVRTLICDPGVPCPADFNGDGGVDGADVEAFFIAWQAADSSADVNQDGGVDGQDLAAFFIPWQAGGC